ncbi:response regulator transcription factor [Aurantimonas sp. A2-1-M11]|uniref:response regulator transcription factor n=1 Tax=Aurantimonas sp. A2-1-M11 TaxID=3113712 RepID=UPI002F9273A3
MNTSLHDQAHLDRRELDFAESNDPDSSSLSTAVADRGLEPPTSKRSKRTLVVFDNRALDRECFVQSLIAHDVGMTVLAFGSISDWLGRKSADTSISAILLNIGGREFGEAAVSEEIKKLSSEFASTPLVVLADNEDLSAILKALEYGARGFIPSSVGMGVCVEAIKLAMAGGVFVPAQGVLAMRQLIEAKSEVARPLSGMFTHRQAEVVQALRRGKANKIIAYELNLRESTVKVHIRNVMKKLKATNRTEVAYKLNEMFPMDIVSQK